MTPQLFWIEGPWPGRLAISARPRGGDWLRDEVLGWRQAGVDVVLSLLSPEEEHDLDLSDEAKLCRAQGIRFVPFPVVDRSVPASVPRTIDLLKELRDELQGGKTVAIHCRQGIGRSSLMAAGLLVTAGMDPEAAFSAVGSARHLAVPETLEQRLWVERLLSDHLALVRG
jgi:protein-tyrosine phosphatase